MSTQRPAPPEIQAVLDSAPQPQRDSLERLRRDLLRILPRAEEQMKYGVPALTLAGHGIVGYQARRGGYSLYPMSGVVLSQLSALPPGTEARNGTLHCAPDQRLPLSFLRDVVRRRLAELSGVGSGTRIEVFSDGGIKAIGSMKNNALHGRWEWFRQDGSLMRKGTFCAGDPVGWWETWAADGTRVSRIRRGG